MAARDMTADDRGAAFLDAIPSNAPRLLDLATLALQEPQPPEFLLPDWLPAGEVTLLGGHGGTGKSALALQLAVAISMGMDFHGVPTRQRPTAYVSFEDSEAVLHWRLARICEAQEISLQELAEVLQVYDGTTVASAWYARGEYGECGLTPAFDAMRQTLAEARVIVVDGSSDVYAGNENDRAQVKAFLRGLRTMIPSDGALLLLAHVDKQAAKVGKDGLGFSGSTGWNNGVRCRWYLYPEMSSDDDEAIETGNVVLEVRKSNLGRIGASMKLRFDVESGVFQRMDTPAGSTPRQSTVVRDAEESVAIKACIRAAHGRGDPVPAASAGTRTAHSVMQAQPGFPDSLRGKRGRVRFYALIESMRAKGEITTESRQGANRNYSEVLNAA